MAVCRTLDISQGGLSLDTPAWFPVGTRLAIALVDPLTGVAIEVEDDKLKLTRLGDFITLGGKFPRLTKKEAKARLKEIKRLLLAL